MCHLYAVTTAYVKSLIIEACNISAEYANRAGYFMGASSVEYTGRGNAIYWGYNFTGPTGEGVSIDVGATGSGTGLTQATPKQPLDTSVVYGP